MRFFTGMAIAAGLTLASASTQAVLFTYEYTGNPFTDVEAPYTTLDSVQGTLTMDLVDNTDLPFGDYRSFIDSFTFTDGHQQLTHIDAFQMVLFMSTNSVGDIVDWDFVIALVSEGISTRTLLDSAIILASLAGPSEASVANQSGVWRQVSTVEVAEPGTLVLLALSLAFWLLFARLREQ